MEQSDRKRHGIEATLRSFPGQDEISVTIYEHIAKVLETSVRWGLVKPFQSSLLSAHVYCLTRDMGVVKGESQKQSVWGPGPLS